MFSLNSSSNTVPQLSAMNDISITKIGPAVDAFCDWLDYYGEVSFDHQSFFASKLGRSAKALYYRRPLLGTLAVAPMIFCEAFVPSARKLFWKQQRLPIADAHYAMGFAFLAEIREERKDYEKAVHFLEVLQQTRCRGYDDYCWGYPFDWQTRNGTIKEDTPLITTVPYVYEAFSQVYALDGDRKWLRIMQSIASHVFQAYRDLPTGPDAASCGYTPASDDPCGVVNASAYRAFLLTKAGIELGEPRYLQAARRNLNFVLACQNPDGSWYYSTDGERDFVDHFHTCFVLKALAKIEKLAGAGDCAEAIERGVRYYLANLVDSEGLPVPFSKRPRLTVYKRELYDFAEALNLGALLHGQFPGLDRVVSRLTADLLTRWQKADGSFRARQLLVGWDNVPMHRWAQSQVFRSLCFLLSRCVDQADFYSSVRQTRNDNRPLTDVTVVTR
ncbi:MAG TPA: prenyltransferase/squalene oxidase repeat-containing protein [Terriglobia bacterium]|nr:prenyltransferase/squalene oxidase repeat-containing protein [Terriglobia bacterium]